MVCTLFTILRPTQWNVITVFLFFYNIFFLVLLRLFFKATLAIFDALVLFYDRKHGIMDCKRNCYNEFQSYYFWTDEKHQTIKQLKMIKIPHHKNHFFYPFRYFIRDFVFPLFSLKPSVVFCFTVS